LPDMCDSTDTTPEFPNGFNPKLRGNITRGTQFYQDACLSPNHLMEYFCGTGVFARIIECTCQDGACLDEHKSTNFRGTILTNDMVIRE
ncbi:MAG: hypothetical protein ACMXYC_04540, partial [Candidatus Woesearchaeota archaeon]